MSSVLYCRKVLLHVFSWHSFQASFWGGFQNAMKKKRNTSDLLSESNHSAKNNEYVTANVETQYVRGDVENFGADWTDRTNDPKKEPMKLLQKVLILPVSGQFGNHSERPLVLCRVQENSRLSAGVGQWVGSWPARTHIDPFCAKDLGVGAPSPVPHYGMAKCPQRLVQGIFIVPVPSTHTWAGWASCYRRNIGDLGWEWHFLVAVPGSPDRNANEELQLQQSPVWWVKPQGMPALSPSAVSLPQWVSHDSLCLLFPWFYHQISHWLKVKREFWWVSALLLRHSSYQIALINSPVWLPKWKLSILSTRKTNLKIHFNSRAIFYLQT